MSTLEAIFPLKVTLEPGYEHFENPCPMLADFSSVNIQFTKYPILQKPTKDEPVNIRHILFQFL